MQRAPSLVCVSAAAFYLNFIAWGSVSYEGRTYFTLFDDAMISLRYAKTLAAGGGFTWNPGETPIEGITNPLWTLWMALLHFAPVPEGMVALLVGLSSGALLLGAAWAARLLARQLGAGERTALVVLAGVAFYYPLAFWSLRGMETGALACLMTWAMVLALRQLDEPKPRRAALLAGMAAALVLVRQDAAIFVVVLAAFAAVAEGARARTTWGALLGGMVAGLVLLVALRLAYYGDALPNTYYLKVTGVTLMERLQRGLGALFSEAMRGHFIVFAEVIVLSVPALSRREPKMRIRLALPLAALLAQAAYSAYVGGDVWELMGYPNRYIVIAMPGLIALTMVLLANLSADVGRADGGIPAAEPGAREAVSPRAREMIFAGIAALLLLQTSVLHAFVALRDGAAYVEYDRAATQVGLCLRDKTPANARIAYTWAGAMPYYADRFGIDLLGKMDAHVARSTPQIAFEPGHNKWDTAYSIDTHKPDIILQLFRAKPADYAAIRERGYVPIDPAWPCLANTFLTPGDVFVRNN